MLFNGKSYQSVWAEQNKKIIYLVNQRNLPFSFEIVEIKTIEELLEAIKNLTVRGAPAIGIAAAYGIWLILEQHRNNKKSIQFEYDRLIHSRPTAVNLMRGANYVMEKVKESYDPSIAFKAACEFAKEEIEAAKLIGEYGLSLIEEFYTMVNRPVNILTHCNAGWLACGDYGTALSPIFLAKQKGIPIHIWVDETQPLLQGARLTAWELYHENISFNILPDNSAGYLMALNKIDMIITGADRIAMNGDVANKIGTYSLAVLAHYHQIPFYVAAPLSTFDFELKTGVDIPIEQRSADEVLCARVWVNEEWKFFPKTVTHFPTVNYAFDITPAHFIRAYITNHGIIHHPQELSS
ncbi:MAG: S-methyl-5-thioribose-1-phosphate isomerase [Bacteroidales bacterium]|nr:S-methyl-5-thioribose-1-phosphate isomerase [Bacteroidales bacterium]